MIARFDDEDIQPSQPSWLARHFPEAGAFLFLLVSVVLYFNSARAPDEPTEWEVERATETPRVYYFGGSRNLMVTAFSPDDGTWTDMPRGDVALGQEFIFMGSFCKEVAPLHAAVYDQNDVSRIQKSFGLFKKDESRVPGPDDSVYVLDRPIPDGGFWPLRYVKPGERIHFEGRIYVTREGSRPDTIILRATGETITTWPSQTKEVRDERHERSKHNLHSF